jgi:hypothetical protein
MRRLDRAFDQLAGRGRRSDPEIVIERLERRLAGEPIPVAVPGRFDMDKSRSSVSGRKGVLIAAAAMVVVLAVAIPLWLVLRGNEPSVLSDETGIAYPPAPAGKTPQATLEELVQQNYAALTNKDAEALRAVNLDEARGLVFWVDQNERGQLMPLPEEYDPAEDIDQVWEALGEFTTFGGASAIPIRVEYPSEGLTVTGFDLWMLERFEGGLLCAGGVAIGASEPFVAPSPAAVADLLGRQEAAWESGDTDAVMADYASDVWYLDALTSHTKPWVSEFFAGIRLEYTGEPATSGPFVAVPTRITDLETGALTDGVSVYWIRDGEIAFHAFSPGT